MRRTILALALTAVFVAEVVPLLMMPNAPHCACVVKSACCRLDVCPMEVKRHRYGVTPSLEACPGAGTSVALPPFLGRTAVMRGSDVALARLADGDAFAIVADRAIERAHPVEVQPPRVWTAATLVAALPRLQ